MFDVVVSSFRMGLVFVNGGGWCPRREGDCAEPGEDEAAASSASKDDDADSELVVSSKVGSELKYCRLRRLPLVASIAGGARRKISPFFLFCRAC